MSNQIISLEGVNIHQDEHKIFNNINLKITNGDFVYLIGETGSGKSSLVKSLYSEIRVSAGSIFVAGHDLNKIKSKKDTRRVVSVTRIPFRY